MLTLLKQARAFGLGVVLSTQNPVDLDYRGLSNTGTWLIGRLQTARDKMRVVEGLASATAGEGMDRAALEGLLNNLRSRVFLMRNVHDDAPVLFETRWCLSYLRGPLSPGQISSLMADKKAAAAPPGVARNARRYAFCVASCRFTGGAATVPAKLSCRRRLSNSICPC